MTAHNFKCAAIHKSVMKKNDDQEELCKVKDMKIKRKAQRKIKLLKKQKSRFKTSHKNQQIIG